MAIGARLDDAEGGKVGAVYVAQVREPSGVVLAAIVAVISGVWMRIWRPERFLTFLTRFSALGAGMPVKQTPELSE